MITSSQETESVTNYDNDSSLSYNLPEEKCQFRPQTTDTTNSISCQEFEDTESGDFSELELISVAHNHFFLICKNMFPGMMILFTVYAICTSGAE